MGNLWLYALPDAALFLLFCGGTVALLLTFRFVVGRLRSAAPLASDIDFGVRSHGALFSACTLVLAFCLVQTLNNHRHAEATVDAEASTLLAMDRVVTRAGDADLKPLREPLRAYAQSIISEEWPAQAVDQPSPRTEAVFNALYARVMAVARGDDSPETYAELIRATDNLAQRREERLEAAEIALPSMFWVIVGFTLTIFAGISSLLMTSAFRAGVVSAQAAILGALLAAVFVNDEPFKGETSIRPTAYVRFVDVFDREAK